jgi:hypothetical protein
MHCWRLKTASLLLAAIVVAAVPSPGLAEGEDASDDATLSPFWNQAVRQWEPIIVHYAAQWEIDPNLVAAIVWKESLGRPTAVSPAGAVGLMGLMPFAWRPSPEELENPWTNVHWGARALAQTIGNGNGDLYYSLAAYNGSWPKAGQNNTRRYAAAVLDLYTRSVAESYGLSPEGEWIALLSVEGMLGPGTLTVLGPHRPVVRYSERPLDVGNLAIPSDVPPHATVIVFRNGRNHECRVNLWLVSKDGAPVLAPARRTSAARVREGGPKAESGFSGADLPIQ